MDEIERRPLGRRFLFPKLGITDPVICILSNLLYEQLNYIWKNTSIVKLKFLAVTTITFLWFTSFAQLPFSHEILLDPGTGEVRPSLIEIVPGESYTVSGSFTDGDTLLGIFSAEVGSSGIPSNIYAHSVDLSLNDGGASAPPFRCSDGGMLYTLVKNGPFIGQTACFMKVDQDGGVQWNKCISDSVLIMFPSVPMITEEEGTYIVSIRLRFSTTGIWHNALLKLSVQGDLITASRFEEDINLTNSYQSELVPYSTAGFLRAQTITLPEPESQTRMILQKWTSDLLLLWSKIYDLGEDHYFKDLQVLSNGDLLITGAMSWPGPRAFICRLDSFGEIIFAKHMINEQFNLDGCIEMNDGSFTCYGWRPQGLFKECLIVRFSADGTFIKAMELDDDYAHYLFNSTAIESDGAGIIFTGTTELHSGIVLSTDTSLMGLCNAVPHTSSVGLITSSVTNHLVVPASMNLDLVTVTTQPYNASLIVSNMCLTTTILSDEELSNSLVVAPNPASGPVIFTVVGSKGQNGFIEIRDPSGRLVDRLAVRSDVITWDSRSLSPGLYLVDHVVDGVIVSIGKLVVE